MRDLYVSMSHAGQRLAAAVAACLLLQPISPGRGLKQMRRLMYDRRANFVRTTKIVDKDFCAFGNGVITRDIVNYEHLLYRSWHLRDVAWEEGYTPSCCRHSMPTTAPSNAVALPPARRLQLYRRRYAPPCGRKCGATSPTGAVLSRRRRSIGSPLHEGKVVD